jgi:intraflagellar transport protein 122
MLILQAKPLRDNPDFLPVCYRCGATNPLLNPFTSKFAKADVCTNCGHTFIRSFINFEILPLVEFIPVRTISDDDAMDLIRQHESDDAPRASGSTSKKSSERKIDDDDVLVIDDDDHVDLGEYRQSTDLFTNAINRALSQQVCITLHSTTSFFFFFVV